VGAEKERLLNLCVYGVSEGQRSNDKRGREKKNRGWTEDTKTGFGKHGSVVATGKRG